MIKFLFFLLLSFPAFSTVKISMDFSVPEFQQGELVKVSMQIDNPDGLELQSLKDKTIGKTIYFYDIKPALKREGATYFEAEGRVIFAQVPASYQVQETVDGKDVIINWGSIKVNPVNAQPKLIFGNFEIPERVEWVLWTTLSALTLILAGLLGWSISGKLKRKRSEKERIVNLKNEVLGCRTYEDVVNLWKRKHLLIKKFPHLKDPFAELEKVLNLHQFKPRQSETEKIEIVESYRKFVRAIEGGFSGI